MKLNMFTAEVIPTNELGAVHASRWINVFLSSNVGICEKTPAAAIEAAEKVLIPNLHAKTIELFTITSLEVEINE